MHIAKCNRPYFSKFINLIYLSWFLSQGKVKTSMFIRLPQNSIFLINYYLDICLKVISLDGAENLPKSSRFYHEMHKLYTQPFTQIHHLHWGSRTILNIKKQPNPFSLLYVDVFKNRHQKSNDCVFQMFLKTMPIGHPLTHIVVIDIS